MSPPCGGVMGWQPDLSQPPAIWWRPRVSNPRRQDTCKASPQPAAAPFMKSELSGRCARQEDTQRSDSSSRRRHTVSPKRPWRIHSTVTWWSGERRLHDSGAAGWIRTNLLLLFKQTLILLSYSGKYCHGSVDWDRTNMHVLNRHAAYRPGALRNCSSNIRRIALCEYVLLGAGGR